MHRTGHRTGADARRLTFASIAVAFTIALVTGCGGNQTDTSQAPQSPAKAPLPIEKRTGWLHGACLAIDNNALAAESPVAIVSLGDETAVIDARIAGVTTASTTCPALLDERRATNMSKGISFYEVRLPPNTTLELGIGVVGNAARVDKGLDVSGDGIADMFTQCSTSEGVSFAVWSGKPYQGAALWSGYYYLGYDAEATCPDASPR